MATGTIGIKNSETIFWTLRPVAIFRPQCCGVNQNIAKPLSPGRLFCEESVEECIESSFETFVAPDGQDLREFYLIGYSTTI
jgi:hypothetical protein